jgi:chromosome segregation ATPase
LAQGVGVQEILLSDWTLDAFKEREEERHRKEEAEATVAPQKEEVGDVSLTAERVRSLAAERDRLVADLAQAQLASETGKTINVANLAQIRRLTNERDKLAAALAKAESEKESAIREMATLRDQIGALTAQHQKIVDQNEKIKASAESVLAQAVIWRDELRAINRESIVAFIKRRFWPAAKSQPRNDA